MDNLIDFMLNVFITGDCDAPVSSFVNGPNNFYAIRRQNGDQGFVFFRHDAEHTLGTQEAGYDRTGPFSIGSTFERSNPQWLHERLCENPLYIARFANHVYKHFFNDGALTSQANIDRFLSRKEEIDLAIIAESARWGDSKRGTPYTRDNEWIQAINWTVEEFFPTRTDIVLGQLQSKGWYPQIEPPTISSGSRVVPRGFQVTMTAPRGQIYYTIDGTDPYQPIDASTEYTNLILENAAKRALVPTAEIQSDWRQSVGFDDADWQAGSGNIGYEQDQGYGDMINIDVGEEMYEKQTGCFIRIPFTVDEAEADSYNILSLRMNYDDGFVVYLNGEKVAEFNAPENPGWDTAATTNHEAESWETFNISSFVNRLIPGENLLAIHGLNVSLTSSDFLMGTELIAGTASNSGTVSENAIEYTAPITINETTHIKAGVFDNVNWSALNEAKFWVLEGMDNLKITEIHYHPLDFGSVENNDGDFEFLELKNIGNEILDLSGMCFSRGLTYTFPDDTEIGPGEFIVLASNKTGFFTRYGFQAFGEYEGQLDNSGETIALNTAAGDTLIKIRYNDKYPWPNSADGDGYSIVSRYQIPYQDQNDAANWKASSEIHGNPGRDNIPVTVQVAQEPPVPDTYQLLQNYPNPFNPMTIIRYNNPKTSHVTLTIYNMNGQEVNKLVDRKQAPGFYSISWDASRYSSGVYFYQIRADGFQQVKKMLLIK